MDSADLRALLAIIIAIIHDAILLLGILVLPLLPWLIAWYRGHRNSLAILALNLTVALIFFSPLFGLREEYHQPRDYHHDDLGIICWVIALVWACSTERSPVQPPPSVAPRITPPPVAPRITPPPRI